MRQFGRTHKRSWQALLPVLLIIVPLALQAATDDASREALLKERREKLRQKWEQRFRDADVDQSRGLSVEEMQAAGLPRRMVSRFGEIDTDHDGEVTPEELLTAREKELEAQALPPRIGRP